MLYINLRLAVAVKWSQSWPEKSAACNLLWTCSRIETSPDRVSGIHRSRMFYSAEPQGVRKSDFYSSNKVYLMIITYKKIATFIEYLDKFAQFKSKNVIRDSQQQLAVVF